MLRNKIMWVLSLIVVASMVLAACQPQTIEVIKTVEVEKEVKVVETQIVEKEVTVVETKVVEVQKEAFTTPNPILSDLKVRQAMAYCTNKLELIKSVYPLVPDEDAAKLVMNTMIPTVSWAYAGDENITIYAFDPEKGAALLDEAGWTLAEGATYRTNAAGDEFSLKFTTTSAAFRQTWAAVWESQMKACGVRIVRLHAPAAWWFGDTTGLARRDFELGAFAWVGQADPGGQTLWACDQIPLPTNGWVGQNNMGWCNEDVSKNIKLANNSLVQQERKDAFTIVQQGYTADVPAIPLFNRTETYAITANLTGLTPPVGSGAWVWNAYEWELPDSDTIVLGFTQEPASLFTLVESAQVAVVANALIGGYGTTDHNFSYQARMQTELSTIESGLASNNDVEVKEGDMVVDVNGEIVALAAGVKVKDASGAEVEFTGSPIMMKQLVVTYKFVDGLTYSDGQPLVKADLELGHSINCDPESGATSFITCDRVGSIEYLDDKSYTVTWKPGVQDPLFFLAPWGWYPAHRVIESESPYKGKTLAEVPAKDWGTLAEIAENPIDVGPYMITGWEKGVQMTYEANPYFYLGAPKTPKIVVKLITAENAEAQLLGGEVDVLDSTTLVGVTETLKAAADEGKIVLYAQPSATWEHIDMNLFVR